MNFLSRKWQSEAQTLDLEAPTSRYTHVVALAVPAGEEWANRRESGDRDAASQAINSLLGDEWTTGLEAYSPTIIDGSMGRGAAAWVPVIEWVGLTIGSGILGGASWSGVKVIVQLIVNRSPKQRILISRGLAIGIAIDRVIGDGDPSNVRVEFSDEPSFVAGRSPTETSYTGIEPWIVSLVDSDFSRRHIVVVAPDGDILSSVSISTTEVEQIYGWLPNREQSIE